VHYANVLQVESGLGRGAEVGTLDGTHDVGVPVDEPHELLQTPEAAFAEAEQALGQVVVERFQLGLDVGEDGPGVKVTSYSSLTNRLGVTRHNPIYTNLSAPNS
jgi:hypothetical protein